MNPTQSICPASGRWPAAILLTLSMAVPVSPLWASETATWIGGDLFKRWDEPANWDKGVVPLNTAETQYTVIIPEASSASYLGGLAGEIDALNLGDNAVVSLSEGSSLQVAGLSLVRGFVQATDSGTSFHAPGVQVVLNGHPRLAASLGAVISLNSSSYEWAANSADAVLLLAEDAGSLVDLGMVGSFTVSPGSGARTFTVRAVEDGQIDLGNVGVLDGPGGDDWLQFVLTTGGEINLESLQRTSGRVRFDIRIPEYALPALLRAQATQLLLSSNVVLALPQLLTLDDGRMAVGEASVLTAPELRSITGTEIQLAAGGVVDVPQLTTVTNSPINIDDEAAMSAPQLTTLEKVPLTFLGNGKLIAPNLTAFRYAEIPVDGADSLQSGLLTDIYASRILVSDGQSFTIGAASYDTPSGWGLHGTLFSADGAGSLLDMSSLHNLRIRGWYSYPTWSHYTISAQNRGVIDMSGLSSLAGPESGAALLDIAVDNTGDILLDSLEHVDGHVRFIVGAGRSLTLPMLRTMSNGCSFEFGFNSRFDAPNLREFVDSEIALTSGDILAVPALTNIYASRFAVTGGARDLPIAAEIYDTPVNWGWHGTLFSARAFSSGKSGDWGGVFFRETTRFAPPVLASLGHEEVESAVRSAPARPRQRAPDHRGGTGSLRSTPGAEALSAQCPARGPQPALRRRTRRPMGGPDRVQRGRAAHQGAGNEDRLEPAPTRPAPGPGGQQQPLSGAARTGPLPQPGLAGPGTVSETVEPRLGGAVGASGAAGRELRGRKPVPGHLLSGLRVRGGGTDRRLRSQQSRLLPGAWPAQAALSAGTASPGHGPIAPGSPTGALGGA